jgi:hypothetical protein
VKKTTPDPSSPAQTAWGVFVGQPAWAWVPIRRSTGMPRPDHIIVLAVDYSKIADLRMKVNG